MHTSPATPRSDRRAGKAFDATLSLRRRELSQRSDGRLLLRYPAISLQVVARIYAQALRLRLKGARWFPHPEGSDRRGSCRREGRLARDRGPPGPLRGVDAVGSRCVEGGSAGSSAPPTPTCRRRSTINDAAAWRGPLRGSLGLGEGYVDGLWETDDLVALIRIAARELRPLDGLRGAVARPRGLLHRLRDLVPENTRSGARQHISAHYDLGNDLFAAFLDQRMMYSCAYFPRPDASLEEAQLAKLERICERLELGPDDHLLEIGTGWGGLAVHAAATTAAG